MRVDWIQRMMTPLNFDSGLSGLFGFPPTIHYVYRIFTAEWPYCEVVEPNGRQGILKHEGAVREIHCPSTRERQVHFKLALGRFLDGEVIPHQAGRVDKLCVQAQAIHVEDDR